MNRTTAIALRILATVIVLGVAGTVIYKILHQRPCNCPDNSPKGAESQEEDYRFDGSSPEDSIGKFLRDFGFTTETNLVAGSAAEITDSLCRKWSKPDTVLFDTGRFSFLEGLGRPNIECEVADRMGYVKYNYAFIASFGAEAAVADTPHVYIYNRTAIVRQRQDGVSLLHLYETPEPIPLRRFSELIDMPFGQPYDEDGGISYPGSRPVFNYGAAGASRVTAWWLPCSADSAMSYCLAQLQKRDWIIYKRGEGAALLLTRGEFPKETLAISSVGDPESASGSLVVMSYQGRGAPFSKSSK